MSWLFSNIFLPGFSGLEWKLDLASHSLLIGLFSSVARKNPKSMTLHIHSIHSTINPDCVASKIIWALLINTSNVGNTHTHGTSRKKDKKTSCAKRKMGESAWALDSRTDDSMQIEKLWACGAFQWYTHKWKYYIENTATCNTQKKKKKCIFYYIIPWRQAAGGKILSEYILFTFNIYFVWSFRVVGAHCIASIVPFSYIVVDCHFVFFLPFSLRITTNCRVPCNRRWLLTLPMFLCLSSSLYLTR